MKGRRYPHWSAEIIDAATAAMQYARDRCTTPDDWDRMYVSCVKHRIRHCIARLRRELRDNPALAPASLHDDVAPGVSRSQFAGLTAHRDDALIATMYAIEGYTMEEVAAALGRSRTYVRAALERIAIAVRHERS